MDADCEFCVKRDICTRDVPTPCRYRYTEEERRADQASDNYGAILAGMYLHKTYEKKTYEKEDNKMKPTSVQNIKNVKDIVFSVAAYSMGVSEDTLTMVIYTDDDVFEFNFEGSDIVQKCKKAGLFSDWEKNQKIKELEEELSYWRKSRMKDDNKRKFVEEYNAVNVLYDNDLLGDQEYDEINRTILRTIIAHFAMELNKEEKKDE